MHLVFICNVQIPEEIISGGSLVSTQYTNTNTFYAPSVVIPGNLLASLYQNTQNFYVPLVSGTFDGDSPDLPYTRTTGITAGSSGSPYLLTTNLNTVETSTPTNNYILVADVSLGVPQFITNFSSNILNIKPVSGKSFDLRAADATIQLGVGATIQVIPDTSSRFLTASIS